MNEADYTRTVIKFLRQRLPPDALVIKIADTFTAGLPDFFISLEGVVTWFEAKKPPRVSYKTLSPPIVLQPSKYVRPLQWEMLCRLKRGYVVFYTDKGYGITPARHEPEQEMRLYKPATLVNMILEAAKL